MNDNCNCRQFVPSPNREHRLPAMRGIASHEMPLALFVLFTFLFSSTRHMLNLALVKASLFYLPLSTPHHPGLFDYNLFKLFFLASSFFLSTGTLAACGTSFLGAVDAPTTGSDVAAFWSCEFTCFRHSRGRYRWWCQRCVLTENSIGLAHS